MMCEPLPSATKVYTKNESLVHVLGHHYFQSTNSLAHGPLRTADFASSEMDRTGASYSLHIWLRSPLWKTYTDRNGVGTELSATKKRRNFEA